MERQSKVLVVDDDPFALRSIAKVLEGQSYQVVTAASGAEALDLLRQDSFDLILTDLKMPEVDGLEILRRGREIAPQAVVLILTGYASLGSAIEALREGAYDYLVKPCADDELKLRIKKGLEIVRLVQERQRAEEALRESKELFEKTFISQRDAIVILDAPPPPTPPTILDCNPATTEIFGYTRQEMLGRTTAFLHVDETMLRQFQEHLYPAIEERGFLHLSEFMMKRKDGTVFPTEHSVAPLKDEQGKRIGWVSVVRDITKRKRAEEALRESEEKYRTLVEQSLQGLAVVQDFRIVFANTAFAGISGYTVEELMSLSPEEVRAIVHPEDQALVWGRFQDRLEGESVPPHYEYRGIRKGGTVHWLEMFARRIEYHGKPAVQAAFLDITERKQAEEEIRQRTAQLEALRQVGLEIAAELDLDSLLHSIVSRAVELVGGTAGGLYLYRPDLDVLVWVMAVGLQMAPLGTVIHRGEGLSGKVWETSEPLIVDDYQQWEGRAAVYEGYPFQAIVSVPVYWGDKFLGVLNVLADAPRTFSPADAELLSMFATQAAIAIRNVCLFEGEQEQRELTEGLAEAAAVVSSTLDPDQVLDRILEQVSRVVPNDAANIMLIEGDQTRIVRWRGYERFGTEEFISTVVFRIPEVHNLQQMVESREPMVILDTATYPGWVRLPEVEWLRS